MVLLLARALDLGGAQRQLIELAIGLQGMGWRVCVLTFYPSGALERELAKSGVELTSLEKGSRWNVLPFLYRTVRLVRRAQPDVVHGYLDMPNIVLALLRPLFGNIRLVWGVRASDVDLSRYDALSRVVFRISVLLSRYADLIICNSEAGRRYCISKGYARERMTVIRNGVDVQRFRPNENARVQIRDEWGISAENVLVGLVARLDPMKDHLTFLDAAAQVLAARSDVRFVCVGTGSAEYRGKLMRRADELKLSKSLVWAGARADTWRIYNALDVAVSASAFGEGTSNVIAEAMATGIRCVSTDVGDAKFLLGELGTVCSPGDSSALAAAILKSLNRANHDGPALRQRIESLFSSTMLVKRTAEQLMALLTNGAVALHSSNQRTKC